jgi:hypothetical protein
MFAVSRQNHFHSIATAAGTAAACMLLSAGAAFAQTDQGTISGSIRDSSGASIPGAKVTLTDTATGFVITETTDASGNYTATPLKLGTYTVKVEAKGFAAATQDNVQVNVSTITTADLQLGVEGTSQNVVVTSAPPSLQTEEASTGQVVSSKVINDTPLNGRNFTFIAQLSAGVTPSEQGSRGANKGDFSANGQRSEQNNFILDGVDNNAELVDFLNGASFVIKPPPDALQEFKVQTGDYTAELGHSAGAVLNVATKSGGNQIHGDLWEYFRNNVLNDRDYFENIVPKYRQNQFGATIGGPIIKNKLFFFGDAEANRIIFGQNGVYTVPTALMRTGNFSELLNASANGRGEAITLYQPGGPTRNAAGAITANNYLNCNGVQNVICPAMVDTVGQNLLNAYPVANRGAAGDTINNYTFQGNASDNTTQYDARVDYNASQHDQAFSRYSYSNEPVTLSAPLGVLDGGGFGGSGETQTEGRNFTLSETHVFTPTFINEFRFGYNWIHAAYIPPNAGSDLSLNYGLGGIPFDAAQDNGGLPNINPTGLTGFGSAQYEPTFEDENVVQILDNVSKQIGNHALKFGVDFERIRVQTDQPVDPKGTLNFSGKFSQDPMNTGNTGFGAADMLLDNMDTASIANIFTSHDQRWYRAAYAQDDWKASSKLTLNMGIRYEYTQPIEELDGQQANFVPNYAAGTAVYLLPAEDQVKPQDVLTPKFLTALAANNVTVQYTNNKFLVNPADLDFSPRLGISYQVDDKTVVRTGYGIFFGGLESVGYYPSLSQNFPFQFDSNFNSGATCAPGNCATNGQTLEAGFGAALSAGLANFVDTPGFRGYSTKTQTPYSQQFNLSIERLLTNSTTLTAAYVGSVSRHLQVNVDGNQPDFPTAPGVNEQSARPYDQFGGSSLVTYPGVANYNSAQVTLQHRLSDGLSFLGAYTWAHTLDDAPTLLGNTGQNSGVRNWRLLGYGYDYGTSYTDVRQRFTLNTQYVLPFGHGQKYMNRTGIMDELAGGWAATVLFRVQTGEPVGIVANNNAAGNGTPYAYQIAGAFATGGTPTSTNSVCATKTHTVATWFNPCSFVNPVQAANIGAYGPPGRTEVAGPGYNRTDISAFKSFPVYKETNVQFRTDVFNLWNTPAYGQPDGTTGGGFAAITGERFGGSNAAYSGTAGETPDARVIQFALKYIF